MSLISKGQVLSCDKVVASIEDDRVTVIDKERCPYFLIYESDNIQDWLADRAFEDQCTTANPRVPLVSELKQILIDSYYGNEIR